MCLRLSYAISYAIGKECRYKEHIQYLDYSLIKLAVNIINRGKLIATDYVTRAKILLDRIFAKNLVQDTFSLQIPTAMWDI